MINNLRPTDLNCNVFSCYDYNGLSMQELLCQFFTAINECIDQTNENKRLTDHLLDVGVSEETSKKIEQLISSGRMAALLNDDLLKNIITNVNNVKNDIVTANNKIEANTSSIGDVDTKYGNKVDEINKKIKELNEKSVTKEAVKEAATEEIKKLAASGELTRATIADKTITNNKLKDGTVSIRSVDFIKRSANLFDKHAKGIKRGVYINDSGTEIRGNSYYISDFISIKSGDTIMVPRLETQTIALYDSNKRWIQTANTGGGGQKYSIPSDDRIAYMTYNGTLTTIEKDMIVLGTTYPSGYVPYQLAFNDDIKDNIIDNILNTADMNAQEKIDEIIDTSINLFDYTMSGYKDGSFITGPGDLTSNLELATITPFIEVEPHTHYSITINHAFYGGNADRVALYDINQRFIKLAPVTAKDTAKGYATILTDGETRYIKFNALKTKKSELMVVKGEVYPLKFIPFHLSLSSQFFFNHKQKEYIDQQVSGDIASKLKGKRVIFDGDSICQGTSDSQGSWAERIIKKHNMVGQNLGISGGTITANLYTDNGVPRHWISRSVDYNLGKIPNPDYIILEGGTNDADLLRDKGKMGEVTDGYTGPFDDTTFIGAVESLFYQYMTKAMGAKIGFIIAHKMGRMSNNNWENSNRRKYFDEIVKLQKKWGIPILDLWYGCYLTPDIPAFNEQMYRNRDFQHLSAKGYDYITPMIESWMETL